MKVVIDTNIYLSGLLFSDSFPDRVLKLAKSSKIQVFTSPFILSEIKKNLINKFDFSEASAEPMILEILKFTKAIAPQNKISIIKEKESDNRILECAVAARADFLITGDKKHILKLKEFRGIKIVSAKEFIMQKNLNL
jgi:uncharacterized protein